MDTKTKEILSVHTGKGSQHDFKLFKDSRIAIDEDVDAIALSLHNGAHLTAFPEVKKHLEDKGMHNIAVIGGGIIPEQDKKELENKGISGNFGPGTSMETIIDHIKKMVK